MSLKRLDKPHYNCYNGYRELRKGETRKEEKTEPGARRKEAQKNKPNSAVEENRQHPDETTTADVGVNGVKGEGTSGH